MGVSRVLRLLTSVAMTVGLFLATLLGGPIAVAMPAGQAPAVEHVAAAKKVRKGKIRVILTGTGTYTIKRKAITRTGTTTRTWRVKPGRYTIKAPGATVTPRKIKVRAGKRVKVRVTFPATPPVLPPTQPPAQPPAPPPASKINPNTITAGFHHTCGIDTAGKAWCWGSDDHGQLGDGNDGQPNEYQAVPVAANLTFTALGASERHTCGIDTTGKAWCWGDDNVGQLGDGNDGQATEYAPAPVAGGITFAALAVGVHHTCGIDTMGKAWCWGFDYDGQLGDGNDDQGYEYAPVAVAGNHAFTQVTARLSQTCGVDVGGKAWCWGDDNVGQLGDGNDGQATEYAPAPVAGGITFAALTAGVNHTCGLDTTGKAWCWGYDHSGQIGDGNDGQAHEFSPVAVTTNLTFTSLMAGFSHTCGIDAAGKVWCWGEDYHGQLGDSNDGQANEYSPVAVASGGGFVSLTLGAYHTCTLDSSGKAWCWGYDSVGQLGDGDDGQADEYAPVPVAGDHTFATTR